MRLISLAIIIGLTGCGNATNQVSGRIGTGATQYTPSVDLRASGKTQGEFQRDVAECRQIGSQRQASEADARGQRTITNTVSGTVGGAVTGYTQGQFLGGFGFDADEKSLARAGAASGLASGLLSGLDSTNDVNAAGKRTVDNCMRGRGYRVF